MKKYLSFFVVFCFCFLASCGNSTDDTSISQFVSDETNTTTNAVSQTLSDFNIFITRDNNEADLTVTSSTTEPAETTAKAESTTEPNSMSATVKETTTQAINKDVKTVYEEYITENLTDFLKNNESVTDAEPLLMFFDLDGDSVDEMVFFLMHPEMNCASMHFYDYIDGEVKHITGSDYVAPYRTADRFCVYVDTDGKYYIRKSYNDGGYMHMATIYSYNGSEFVPVYSMYGCFNEPEFYYVSDNGADAYLEENVKGNFRKVTREEFELVEEDVYNRGTVKFHSTKMFE